RRFAQLGGGGVAWGIGIDDLPVHVPLAGGAHEADEAGHVARAIVPALAELQLLNRNRRPAAREEQERIRGLDPQVFGVGSDPAPIILLRSNEEACPFLVPAVRP